MQFYRRPVFFFALFAVVALVMPLASAQENSEGFLSNAWSNVKEGWDKFTNSEAGKKAAELGQKVQETAQEGWDKVKNSEAADKIQDGFDKLKDTASDLGDKISDKAKELTDKASN